MPDRLEQFNDALVFERILVFVKLEMMLPDTTSRWLAKSLGRDRVDTTELGHEPGLHQKTSGPDQSPRGDVGWGFSVS
jgi:hypothetical protein